MIHYFVVGRVFEQESVDWLVQLARDGHPIGNHTYDHVHLKATTPEDTQFRFQRAPWLVAGKSAEQIIRENIQLCTTAMQSRLNIRPAGFRTPGGFHNGLHDAPQVQQMLLDLGFKWVSATYPSHPNTKPGETPTEEVFDGIVKAQAASQPFTYASGLIDVPMSPISDIGAFRNGRWKLPHFLEAIRRAVEWTIENGACFDFLGHPVVLYAMDPEFRAIELICELVKKSATRARLVSLDQLAQRASVSQ
jgi:peptidoglycan/xylan/chitin deacetylase (PgdA/CDA1 family)